MKIGILSDTHMIKDCIDKTIPYLKECDLIIHAGDNFSDSKYIHNMTKVGIMAESRRFRDIRNHGSGSPGLQNVPGSSADCRP